MVGLPRFFADMRADVGRFLERLGRLIGDVPTADEPAVDPQEQVRQLIKQALEEPTLEQLTDFLDFTNRFRRLAVWNARMAYIQRPGAKSIASEWEWRSVGREVQPDAVPIIILWPFSPIRFVYELADTGPPIERKVDRGPVRCIRQV